MPAKKNKSVKLSDEALEALAQTFRLLADEVRLSLLQELKEGERMVGELVEVTGHGQASVSKHLKALYEGGLLERRKDGVKVYYGVKGEFVFSLCKMVCQRLDDEQKERGQIEFMI
ncbi:MAG: ArsR/SmtB family transcription factor [Roseibacillus sp.]